MMRLGCHPVIVITLLLMLDIRGFLQWFINNENMLSIQIHFIWNNYLCLRILKMFSLSIFSVF